jgi:hypothetical protein
MDFHRLILIFFRFCYVNLLQIENELKIDLTLLGWGVGEFPENVSVQAEMLLADDNFFP